MENFYPNSGLFSRRFFIFGLLLAILALGFFLRIYNIDQTPPGVYPDEAVNGIDAVNANRTGDYQWFYPDNQGREGLFMNLIALLFKFFGISVLTLKFPAIFFGTLTILGTYLLTKELFQRERLALISAFLVATSFWAINFNRISFRANMLPFILVFAFYFLFRGMRTKKYLDFVLGGIVFGVEVHTYIAFRIAPLILIVMLFSFLLVKRQFIREYWKKIAVFVLATTIISFPMLYTFFWSHPEYFESRSSSISILSPEVNQGHLVTTFLKSFGLSLAKYNFWGDQNWRHNFPPYPVLDPIIGIAFLFGFIWSGAKLLKLLFLRFFRGLREEELNIHLFLMAWFFVMLVPEFMTAEGLPHALRAIGTLPVVFIFSALTIEFLFQQTARHGLLIKKISELVLILMLIFTGTFNALKYHLVWANKTDAARAFSRGLRDVSDYLQSLPAATDKFVVIDSMGRIPVKLFNQEMANVYYFYPSEGGQIRPLKEGDTFKIIMTEKSDSVINELQSRFPSLVLREIKDRYGITFYVLEY